MTEYDIAKLFDEMELELIRAMKGHYVKGLDGTSEQWKRKQLQELKRFRKENKAIIDKYTEMIKDNTLLINTTVMFD